MVTFSIIDESFDTRVTSSYFFSVRLNPDGFSYCTLDPVRNKYIQIGNIVLNEDEQSVPQLNSHFSSIDILNLPYKKTLILVPTRTATIVPSGIFEPDKAETLLRFCCEVSENETIHYNKVRAADAFNIFSIRSDIETFFKMQFPEPVFLHQNTPLIDSYLSSSTICENETNFVCINFNAYFFDIVVFDKSGLKLCNSFPAKNENDVVYYTLFTFEQLKFAESATTVFISGINDANRKFSDKLSRYLSRIKYVEFPNNFRYAMKFKDARIAGFYNLFSLSSCV